MTPQEPLSRDIPVIPGQPEQTFSLRQLAPPPRRPSPLPYVVTALAVLVAVAAVSLIFILFAGRDGAEGGDPEAVAVTATTAAATPTTPTRTTAAAPTTAADLEVEFGDTLVMTNSIGDEVEFTVRADKTYSRSKYGTKPEKGIYYGVKVEIVVKDGSDYVIPQIFALIASDGTAYEGTGHVVQGGLEGIQLNAGQKAAGVVVFDIPQGAHAGGRIELRTGSFSRSSNQGFWRIP